MIRRLTILLLIVGCVFSQQSNKDTTMSIFKFEKQFDFDDYNTNSTNVDIYFKNGSISNYREFTVIANANTNLGKYTENIQGIGLPDSIIINLFDIYKIVIKDMNGNEIKTISGTIIRIKAEGLALGVRSGTKSMEYFGEKYLKLKKYIPYIIVCSIVVLLTTL